MVSYIEHAHIVRRLKIVHYLIIIASVIFFALLFFVGTATNTSTLAPQLVLLLMGGVMAFSYLSLLPRSSSVTIVPLISLFIVNILTSILVWFTGILESPFVPLYLLIIIITTQLYRYSAGLAQTVVAFGGLIAVFHAVSIHRLPFYSIIPGATAATYYQPVEIVLLFGAVYALLFIFTALSSSNARMVLYRPAVQGDATYHEQIVRTMPMGVCIVDDKGIVLTHNEYAQKLLHCANGKELAEYIKMPRETLRHLGSGIKEKTIALKHSEKTVIMSVAPHSAGTSDAHIVFFK